jgi:phosphoglucosamine mutase
VFKELDAEVFVYGNAPNGLNINLDCGALHPEMVQKAVIEHHAHVGIALDGDADRVIMVDENAQIINGDTLLAICALDMKRRGVLQHNKVVATVMSNLGFIKSLEANGIEVIQAQVGDRYVIQEMLENGCNLGGEQSGHLIFLDHNTTGDGLVAALQVLKIMKETGSTLSELASIVQRYPQTLVNVKVKDKKPLQELIGVNVAQKAALEQLADQGRVLLRYSGTENILRVMVEGSNWKLVQQLAENIARAAKEELGETGEK